MNTSIHLMIFAQFHRAPQTVESYENKLLRINPDVNTHCCCCVVTEATHRSTTAQTFSTAFPHSIWCTIFPPLISFKYVISFEASVDQAGVMLWHVILGNWNECRFAVSIAHAVTRKKNRYHFNQITFGSFPSIIDVTFVRNTLHFLCDSCQRRAHTDPQVGNWKLNRMKGWMRSTKIIKSISEKSISGKCNLFVRSSVRGTLQGWLQQVIQLVGCFIVSAAAQHTDDIVCGEWKIHRNECSRLHFTAYSAQQVRNRFISMLLAQCLFNSNWEKQQQKNNKRTAQFVRRKQTGQFKLNHGKVYRLPFRIGSSTFGHEAAVRMCVCVI